MAEEIVVVAAAAAAAAAAVAAPDAPAVPAAAAGDGNARAEAVPVDASRVRASRLARSSPCPLCARAPRPARTTHRTERLGLRSSRRACLLRRRRRRAAAAPRPFRPSRPSSPASPPPHQGSSSRRRPWRPASRAFEYSDEPEVLVVTHSQAGAVVPTCPRQLYLMTEVSLGDQWRRRGGARRRRPAPPTLPAAAA